MTDLPKIELDLEKVAPVPPKPPLTPIPPALARPYAPPQAPLSDFTPASFRVSGLRLAGLWILINVFLSAWLIGQGNKGGLMLGSVIFDGIIAPMLLLGMESVRKWALFRSVMGLLLGSVLAYSASADSSYAWVAVALNALYCGGIILLLYGEELGLGQFIAGGAMTGVSLCLIVAAMVYAHSNADRDPVPQQAFQGRVTLLSFHAFVPRTEAMPDSVTSKFDETGLEQALSPAGIETVWLYKPKAGVRMDPDKALRTLFRQVEANAGQAPSGAEPQAESHGDLDGESISGTIQVKGHPFHAKMFAIEKKGAVWMFFVLLPEQRDPNLCDRIFDSIQFSA